MMMCYFFSSSYAQVIKTFFIPLSTSKPLYTFDIMCIFYKFFLLHPSKHSKQGSRQTSLDYIWFVLFCFISTLWKNIAMRDNIITRTFLCDMEKNIVFILSFHDPRHRHPNTTTLLSLCVCVSFLFLPFIFLWHPHSTTPLQNITTFITNNHVPVFIVDKKWV